jgi:hypothetical protein
MVTSHIQSVVEFSTCGVMSSPKNVSDFGAFQNPDFLITSVQPVCEMLQSDET